MDDFREGGDTLPVPRQDNDSTSAGTRALISRDAQEITGLVMVAQRLPRDEDRARMQIADAFKRPKLAEQAQYMYVRGGTEVLGPSIRAAEALAQRWGRMGFGFRVLGESIGPDGVTYSEVRAYALDYQNVIPAERIFNVKHWRATRQGGYKLTDDRDVSELIANMAARRMRACILAVIPSDVVDDAMKQAEETLAATVDVSPAAQARMVDAFAQFGVDEGMIERRIQRSIQTITPKQKIALQKIWVALRDGAGRPNQFFSGHAAQSDRPRSHVDAVREANATQRTPPPVPPVQPPAAPAVPAEEHPAAASPDDAPGVDPADVLRRIAAAQTLEELQTVDDYVGALPEGSDKAMFIEALVQRDRLLSDSESN